MIYCPEFTFVHIPKTGGTWMRHVLSGAGLPGLQSFPDHAGLTRLPEQFRSSPVFACVRNPWDWHVSRYMFWAGHWSNRTGGYARSRELWTRAELWWDRLFSRNAPSAEHFRSNTKLMLREFQEDGEPRGLVPIARWEGHLLGDHPWEPVRFEHLRADTEALVARLLAESPQLPALRAAIRAEPPRMTSSHRHYSTYYDDELRDLVGELDASWIERFGYTFTPGACG